MNPTNVSLLISSVSLILNLSVSAQENPKALSQDESSLEKVIGEANESSKNQEKLGTSLLGGFCNVKNSEKIRVKCALALGKMRYAGAIKKLIEFIELRDSTARISEPSAELLYPCVKALMEIGIEVVPSIINAYLVEDNETRILLLRSVLRANSIRETAARYIQGVATEIKEESARIKMDGLVKLLREK